jgi:hypothetical protein
MSPIVGLHLAAADRTLDRAVNRKSLPGVDEQLVERRLFAHRIERPRCHGESAH